jgi:dynein heavy chain
MLFSYGYMENRECAQKMVATFRLCSEQLSSQDHYDYGMRAVISVLRAAGNLKRSDGHLPEDVLVLRAIVDVNLPKFLAPDLPLFKGIMSDLFPTIAKPNVDHGDLAQALVLCTEKRGLQPVPHFILKCVQVYEMVVVRHGMMMVNMDCDRSGSCLMNDTPSFSRDIGCLLALKTTILFCLFCPFCTPCTS